MRKLLWLFLAVPLAAQVSYQPVRDSATDPTGVACTGAAPILRYTAAGTSTYFGCTGTGGTAYAALGGGSGPGTVNSGTTGQLGYYAANGTAISGTAAVPNGTTATTQTVGDNTTKVATDAFVLANAGSGTGTGFVFTTTQTLGAPAAVFSFTSIPATAKDLTVTCSYVGAGIDLLLVNFNNDATQAHYFSSRIYASSGAVNIANVINTGGFAAYTNSVGTSGLTMTVPKYLDTTFASKSYRSLATRVSNDGSTYVNEDGLGEWTPVSPTAISRIDVTDTGGNFATGSTCTLRGLP